MDGGLISEDSRFGVGNRRSSRRLQQFDDQGRSGSNEWI